MAEQVKYNIGNGHEISVEYDEYNQAKITRECFEALIGKKIPKKPIGNSCPICGADFCSESWERDYCCLCGQKLDWKTEIEE